jgi:hypothetical protein
MSASITSSSFPRASMSFGGSRSSLFGRVWTGLARASARRAGPELHRLAELHVHGTPELARQLRAAARRLTPR